jgi:hypothetical protein
MCFMGADECLSAPWVVLVPAEKFWLVAHRMPVACSNCMCLNGTGDLTPDLPISSAPRWQVQTHAQFWAGWQIFPVQHTQCCTQMLDDAAAGLHAPDIHAALGPTTNCAYSEYASLPPVWFHSL